MGLYTVGVKIITVWLVTVVVTLAGNETSTPVAAIFASDNSAVTGITQISGGGDHVINLKSDGTVYGAGYNATWTNWVTVRLLMQTTGLVQVQGVGGSSNLTGITQIAACDSTSLALKNDGTMYSWGNNYGWSKRFRNGRWDESYNTGCDNITYGCGYYRPW
jgi:alpha-tubulin suppressor-like RCC1 family protein